MTSQIDPAVPAPSASVAAVGVRQNFAHMRDEITALEEAAREPLNFTITEEDTGLKWIDGKPVYQRTIRNFYTAGSHPARPPGATVTLASQMSVIDALIALDFVALFIDTGPGIRYAEADRVQDVDLWIEGDDLKLHNGKTAVYTYNAHLITLRYTKV